MSLLVLCWQERRGVLSLQLVVLARTAFVGNLVDDRPHKFTSCGPILYLCHLLCDLCQTKQNLRQTSTRASSNVPHRSCLGRSCGVFNYADLMDIAIFYDVILIFILLTSYSFHHQTEIILVHTPTAYHNIQTWEKFTDHQHVPVRLRDKHPRLRPKRRRSNPVDGLRSVCNTTDGMLMLLRVWEGRELVLTPMLIR